MFRGGIGARLAALIVTITLSLSVIINVGASANSVIEVAPSGAQKTHLTQAANGVPVVDIASPNGAGVSHNKFHKFNVGNRGVVLNNSTQDAVSQLGGAVFANRNLQRSASTIINEVTSTHRSNIMGSTEVLGPGVDYILANPNGIFVNGGEFININNATLTTGRVYLDNQGAVEKFIVDSGKIEFAGRDVNLAGLDHFDVVCRLCALNAAIHNSQKVNITTGKGAYDYKAKKLSPQSNQQESGIEVDSSALGGIYAGKIKIISNSKGVGVNLPSMASATGEISITADGDIKFNNLESANNVTIKSSSGAVRLPAGKTNKVKGKTIIEASRGISLEGQSLIKSADTIKLTSASGEVNIAGSIKSQAQVGIIISSDDLVNKGYIVAPHGQISLMQKGKTVNKGTISSGGQVFLQAATNIENEGIISAPVVNIDSPSAALVNRGGIFATKDVSIVVGEELLNEGQIISDQEVLSKHSEGDFSKYYQLMPEEPLNAIIAGGVSAAAPSLSTMGLESAEASITNKGLIYSSGNLSIKAKGDICNDAASVVISRQHLGLASSEGSIILAVDGGVSAGKELVGFAGGDIINAGKLSAESSLFESGSKFVNNGLIESRGDFTLMAGGEFCNENIIWTQEAAQINVGGSFNNSGQIVTKGSDLYVSSPNELVNSGSIFSGGIMELEAEGLVVNSGELRSDGALLLKSAGDIRNEDAILTSGELSIKAGDSLFNSGQVMSIADVTIEAAAALVNEEGGAIKSDGVLQINILAGRVSNAGKLNSASDLKIQAAGDLQNINGQLESGQDMQLTIGGDLANAEEGIILAERELQIATEGDLLNAVAGQIITKSGDITIDSGGDIGNSGGAFSARRMAVSSRGRLQNSGILQATDRLELAAASGIVNTGSVISAAEEVRLISDGNLENQGIIWAKNTLQVRAGGDVVNSGKMQSTEDAVIESANIFINEEGGEINAKSLNINAENEFENKHIIHAEQELVLTAKAGTLTNQGEMFSGQSTALAAAKSIINQRGKLIARGDLAIKSADGSLLNEEAIISAEGVLSLVVAHDFINNSGAKLASNYLDAGQLDKLENKGEILVGEALSAQKIGQLSNAGTIKANKYVLPNIGKLTNESGGYLLGAQMDLEAEEFANLGSMKFTGTVDVKSDDINNSGQIEADTGYFTSKEGFNNSGQINAGSLNIDSGKFVNSLEAKIKSDSLNINTGMAVNKGAVFARNAMVFKVADKLTNQGGLVSAGSMLIESVNRRQIENQGMIYAKSQMEIIGGDFSNKGEVNSASYINVSAHNLYNTNKIVGANEVLINAAIDNRGLIASNGRVVIDAGSSSVNNSNKISAGGNLKVSAYGLSNSSLLEAGGGLRLAIGAGGVNNSGSLYGSRVEINSAGEVNNTARIISKGHLAIASDNDIINKSGAEISAIEVGGLSLRARNIVNSREYELEAVDEAAIANQLALAEEAKKDKSSDNWGFIKKVTGTESYFDKLKQVDQVAPKIYSNASISIDAAGALENVAGVIYGRNDVNIVANQLHNQGILYQKHDLHKEYNELGIAVYKQSGRWKQGSKSFKGYEKRKTEFVGSYWLRSKIQDEKTPHTTPILHAGGTLKTQINGELSLGLASEEQKDDLDNVRIGSVPGVGSNDISSQPEVAIAAISPGNHGLLVSQLEPTAAGELASAAGLYQQQYGEVESGLGNIALNQEELANMAANIASNYNYSQIQQAGLGASEQNWDFSDREIQGALAGGEWFKPAAPSKYWIKETSELFTDFEKYFSTESFIQRVPGYDPRKEAVHFGDPLKQMQLLQSQMLALTGMMSIDDSLSAPQQMQKLYEGGEQAAKKMQLSAGVSLSAEQVAALQEDIVWPELVNIDGNSVLVPKIYLASSKVSERASGIIASNIDIKAGSISNEGSRIIGGGVSLVATSGNISNDDGLILSENHLHMAASGDIRNSRGGQIKSKDSAELSAENIVNITDATTYGNERSSFTIVGDTSSINAVGALKLTARSDILNIGADIGAGQLAYNAGGDFSSKSLRVSSHVDITSANGHFKQQDVLHKAANMIVAGDATGDIGGNFSLIGSKLKVAGDSSLKVAGDVLLASKINSRFLSSKYSSKNRDSLGAVIKDEHSNSSYHESLAISGIEAGGKSSISSGGEQKYIAAKMKAGKGTVLKGSKIKLKGLKLDDQESSSKSSKNSVWQAQKGSGYSEESFEITDFTGDLTIAKDASVEIDYHSKATGSDTGRDGDKNKFEQELSKPEWMKALEGRGNVSFSGIETESKSWDYNQEGMTPEASAAISLAVTAATAGSVPGGGLTLANLMTVTGNAMLGSLASMASVSAINNRLDLGKVASDVTSRKSVKSIGQSGAIAGLTFGLGAASGLGKVSSEMGRLQRFQGMAEKEMLRNMTSSVTRGAMSKEGLKLKHFSQGLQKGGGSAILAVTQSVIGDVGVQHDLGDGSIIKGALHGLAGGLYAEANNRKFVSGAMGGAVSEFTSGFADRADTFSIGDVSFAAGAATLLTGGSAKEITTASNVAASAYEHNFLPHLAKAAQVAAKALAKKAAKEGTKAGAKEGSKQGAKQLGKNAGKNAPANAKPNSNVNPGTAASKFDPAKKGNFDKARRDPRYGKLYRDKKDPKVWWSKDRSGDRGHGGQHWKRFRQKGDELIRDADVDMQGNVMPKNLQGSKKVVINLKDTIGIK